MSRLLEHRPRGCERGGLTGTGCTFHDDQAVVATERDRDLVLDCIELGCLTQDD